jgi:hypothetical protein
MLSDHFYHASIRRTIAAFGTIFNDIKIMRKGSDGEVKNIMRVPLAYGPKQKFLARLESQPSLTDPKVAIKLPRMSFEITGLVYDAASKLPKMNQIVRGSGTTRDAIYTSAPYNMGIQLSIMAKNQDDALQIIEQIIPYFQPEYTITINEVPEVGIKSDVPITLSSVVLAEDYEGDFLSRRAIVYTLDFELKVKFYGPVQQRGVIVKAEVDMINAEAEDPFGFLEEYIADGTNANGDFDNVIEGIDEVDDGEITP